MIIKKRHDLRYRSIVTVLTLGLFGCTVNTGKKPVIAAVTNPKEGAASLLFEEIASKSGINFEVRQTKSPLNILETIGHGVGIIDVDGDGLMDIVLLGPDKVRLYRNLGSGKFTDITQESGLRQPGNWSGVAVGDYDNDGKPDLLICGYNSIALYHNEGSGKFRDVTVDSGLETPKSPSRPFPEWRTSAGFMDIDGDGKLDLYICRYSEIGRAHV